MEERKLHSGVLASVIEGLPLGLIVIDPQGEIVLVNEALTRILEIGEGDCLGRGWAEVFVDGDANLEFNQIIVDVIRREPVRLMREVPYCGPGGRRVFLSVTSSFLREDGALSGIVLLVEDVTEKQLLQERERELLREREVLQAEREKSLKALALSVAHQIRNPAMAMGGMALALLRRKTHDERMGEFLGSVVEGSERLDRVVRAVTQYAGVPEAVMRETTLREVLAQAAEDVVTGGEHRARSMTLEAEQGEALVFLDSLLMAQAFGAVLQNSVDFCGRDRVAVRVGATISLGGVRVAFEDDGPGIADEHLPYVLDPFYTTKSDGVGMGLTMASRIAKEHFGAIEIARSAAGGARVVFVLPRCAGPKQECRTSVE